MNYSRLILILALGAVAARATPITWTLDGVTTLGTAVTGSFVFDADTSTYSSIDITTSGGSVIPDQTWTVLANCCVHQSNQVALVDTSASDQTGADFLGLLFAGSFTDAGGSIALLRTGQGTCFDAICDFADGYPNDPSFGVNVNVTGSAVAVAEPSGFGVILVGFGLILFLRPAAPVSRIEAEAFPHSIGPAACRVNVSIEVLCVQLARN